MLAERGHVLVATARQPDDHGLSGILASPAASASEGVSGLQRRQNALKRRALVQRIQGLIV
jgi:hypothetical protein